MARFRLGAGRGPDDTLQLYRNAEFAAATIPGARKVTFARGGHLLMVVEQATLRPLIEQHLREHLP